MEGDSVTLHTGVTDIQRDDQILWKFGDEVIRTDRLNGPVDARWENIHLNDQTGELTISNIRIDQSGDYEVNTSSLILHRKFHINISEMVPVMEGDSLSLHIDFKIKKDDQIQWMFGPKRTCIAEINRAVNNISLYEDALDGRFRDRLELDEKNGSLTITNTTNTDSGLYTAKITSSYRKPKFIRLLVAVSRSDLSPGAIAAIVIVPLLVFIVVVVIYYCCKISQLNRRRDVEKNETNDPLKTETANSEAL